MITDEPPNESVRASTYGGVTRRRRFGATLWRRVRIRSVKEMPGGSGGFTPPLLRRGKLAAGIYGRHLLRLIGKKKSSQARHGA